MLSENDVGGGSVACNDGLVTATLLGWISVLLPREEDDAAICGAVIPLAVGR